MTSEKNAVKNSKPSKKIDPDQSQKDWQEQEDYLEEALEETFPGSDPIAPGHVKKPARDL